MFSEVCLVLQSWAYFSNFYIFATDLLHFYKFFLHGASIDLYDGKKHHVTYTTPSVDCRSHNNIENIGQTVWFCLAESEKSMELI